MSLNPLEEMYNAKPTLNEVDRIRLSDELERNAVEDTPSSEDDTKPQQQTESSKEDKNLLNLLRTHLRISVKPLTKK